MSACGICGTSPCAALASAFACVAGFWTFAAFPFFAAVTRARVVFRAMVFYIRGNGSEQRPCALFRNPYAASLAHAWRLSRGDDRDRRLELHQRRGLSGDGRVAGLRFPRSRRRAGLLGVQDQRPRGRRLREDFCDRRRASHREDRAVRRDRALERQPALGAARPGHARGIRPSAPVSGLTGPQTRDRFVSGPGRERSLRKCPVRGAGRGSPRPDPDGFPVRRQESGGRAAPDALTREKSLEASMLSPDRIGDLKPLTSAAADYDVVRRAVEFISRRRREQPEIEAIAAASGVTPTELHHLFRRWAGLTPKDFLAALTLNHARALLRDSASVLDASYEVGLSGPGRLHDLFVTHDAVSPGEWKSGGDGLVITYG